MENHLLRLRQLESALKDKVIELPPRPKNGWIAEFRKALLMTSAQLAKRLGIDRSTVKSQRLKTQLDLSTPTRSGGVRL